MFEKKILIMYSGGLDSLIMKHLADTKGYKVNCLFFDIGQPYVDKELAALPDFVDVRKVDWLKEDQELAGKSDKGSKTGNIFIPGRNLTLAALGASIYTPDEIWMGALQGEMGPNSTDKNRTFLKKANEAFSYVFSPYSENLQIKFPLADMNFGKFEAVEWALSAGLPVESILASSSCLNASESKNCGRCAVCARRKGIFTQLGFSEEYEVDPFEAEENRDMIEEMVNGSYYDEFRCREIVPALEMLGIKDNFVLDN